MSWPDPQDERGAVLALVALGLATFLGCAAIAVDLGNVWAHRRAVTTSVDAAALAAAHEYASGGTGCTAVAADYVARNLDGAALTGCAHVSGTAGAGRVEVTADVGVDHWFAPVLGFSSTDVAARTTAYYGPASAAEGVRPVGLCAASAAYRSWSGQVPSAEVLVPFEVDDPTACGPTGAWAIVGVPCGVGGSALATGSTTRITPTQPTCFEDAASAGDVVAAIDGLRAAGEPVVIPVFELFGEVPKIVALVGIEFSGPMETAESPADLAVPVRFVATVTTGECCSPTVGRGVRVVGICRTGDTGTNCP